MLLLVLFLNHVDESRDKALKLASLRQLKSKVNLNLPVEQPTVFILIEVSGYDSRSLGGGRHMCQQSSHTFRQVNGCTLVQI